MLFLLLPHAWWFGFYYAKTKKMVEYQLNLEAWLQEASLFKNEPVDNAINFDELFSTEKANQEGSQDFLGLDDLRWLDEKVDLAIFDNPNSLLDHCYEMNSLMDDDDDAAFILGLEDGNDSPTGLPSDSLKISEIDLGLYHNSSSISGPASPDAPDTHLASPGCTALQVHSPISCQSESPASPAYSDISDGVSDASFIDPGSQSTHGKTGLSPEVIVRVCDSPSTSSSSDEAMTIEDVFSSVKKRKFVSNGNHIPKVKVMLRELDMEAQESSKKSKASRPRDRKERKKLQNKEAAARYRIKKRMEDKERSDEIAGLEATQKQLKEKHDSLQSEIKYLKSLMCEILQKKGVMK